MNDLISWLRQQLDDDERWALAASQPYRHADEGSKAPEGGVHWRWVTGDEWETTTPAPAVDEFVTEAGYPCWLVTVEEWPVTHRLLDGTPLVTRAQPNSYATEIVEMDSAAAGHIIRHDPARVLRQVQAHRAILNRHGFETTESEGSPPFHYCLTCGSGEPHEYPTQWPCATLLDLVSIYSDRDGFKEEWSA